MKDLLQSPKSWTEDFFQENGSYLCNCMVCKEQFMGHKRRVVCKVCSDAAWYDVQGDKDNRDFLKSLGG